MAGDRPLKAVEFYAGVGGFHYALKESGANAEICASIDINTNTIAVYSRNFPNTTQLNRNICGLTAQELDGFGADIFFLSPPCQPFTRQGNQLDSKDRRTDSFFHLMHVLKEMYNLPSYILMENVKGFESSLTRKEFVEILTSLHFDIQEFLLSPNQFRVPNSRLRFYLLAKKTPLKFKMIPADPELPSEDAEKLMMCIGDAAIKCGLRGNQKPDEELEQGEPVVQNRAEVAGSASCRPVLEFLQDISEDELQQFLVPDKILSRYAIALDIVQRTSAHSCCFTKAYGNYAVGTGSILQHYLDEEAMKEAFGKFLKCQEEKDFAGSVEQLRGLSLRYFTPREVANLMCFPKEFAFPDGLITRSAC